MDTSNQLIIMIYVKRLYFKKARNCLQLDLGSSGYGRASSSLAFRTNFSKMPLLRKLIACRKFGTKGA